MCVYIEAIWEMLIQLIPILSFSSPFLAQGGRAIFQPLLQTYNRQMCACVCVHEDMCECVYLAGHFEV